MASHQDVLLCIQIRQISKLRLSILFQFSKCTCRFILVGWIWLPPKMTASPFTIVEHDLYAPEFSPMDALSPTSLPFSLNISLSLNWFSKSFTVVLIKSRWSASILCSQKTPSKPFAQEHSKACYGFVIYDSKWSYITTLIEV